MRKIKLYRDIILIVTLVTLISALHYATKSSLYQQHIIYRELYFIPITLAGFLFGLRGSLITSISITLIYTPLTVIGWQNFSANDLDKIAEIILYNAFAIIIGLLIDRMKAEHKRLLNAESLAVMGRAVSNIAHDMKTPLIAIGGFTRLVQKTMNDDDHSYAKLEIVVHETQRLESMVKEMLDFSRPLELSLSQIDINKLIKDSMAVIEETAKGRNVNIETAFENNLPLVSVDEMRIEEALINLLVNAIQASPEGESVTISTGRENGYIWLDVKDDGCGIPEDNKKTIFYPFFTTKKEGTGLGLPIVKRIIEAHKGRVTILDNCEKGVTFRVMLPLS